MQQKTHIDQRVALIPSIFNTPVRNGFPHNQLLQKGRRVHFTKQKQVCSCECTYALNNVIYI